MLHNNYAGRFDYQSISQISLVHWQAKNLNRLLSINTRAQRRIPHAVLSHF